MMKKGFSIIVLFFQNITANFRAEFPNPDAGVFFIAGGVITTAPYQVGNESVSAMARAHVMRLRMRMMRLFVVPAQPVF